VTRFRHPIAFALTTVAVFMTLSSAAAQSTQPPRTPVPVQAQIQKRAQLQRQALHHLTARQRAEGLLNTAYAELADALSTMIIKASNAKFQDPLFEMQKKRAEQALALLQVARDVLHSNRQDQPKDQDKVRNNLEQALRLTSTLAY